jgi:hypothetical protein
VAPTIRGAERQKDAAQAPAAPPLADERRLPACLHLGRERQQRLLRARAIGPLPARIRKGGTSRQAHQRSRTALPAELRRAGGAAAEEDPPEIDLRDAEQVHGCPWIGSEPCVDGFLALGVDDQKDVAGPLAAATPAPSPAPTARRLNTPSGPAIGPDARFRTQPSAPVVAPQALARDEHRACPLTVGARSFSLAVAEAGTSSSVPTRWSPVAGVGPASVEKALLDDALELGRSAARAQFALLPDRCYRCGPAGSCLGPAARVCRGRGWCALPRRWRRALGVSERLWTCLQHEVERGFRCSAHGGEAAGA